MTINYLFFISKKIVARKQILQVTNMCYDARPIFILYLQPNRSIWYWKRINELIIQYFFTFLPKHLVILAVAAVKKYWRRNSKRSQIHSLQVFLAMKNFFCIFSFWKFDDYTFGPFEIFSAVFSKSFWSVVSEIPLISRYFRLEYWELLQHWRSKESIWSFSLLLTYLATPSSDSSLM